MAAGQQQSADARNRPATVDLKVELVVVPVSEVRARLPGRVTRPAQAGSELPR